MLLAAAFAWSGCSREAVSWSDSADGEPILFAASGSRSSRTEVEAGSDGRLAIVWSSGDAVGIYGMNDGRSIGNNYTYVATPFKEDPSRCSFSAEDPTRIFAWKHGASQGYYAYYPYVSVEGRELSPTSHPFSLPAVQTQVGADSPAHLAQYGLLTAQPVEIAATDESHGGILFTFANLFSIVEVRLRMNADCPIDRVPLKQIRLVAESGNLAIPAGTIDLTQPVDAAADLPVTVETGSAEVALGFSDTFEVDKEGYVSAYLVVAPGHHAAGSVRMEITAIDNSIRSEIFPEAIVLEPNRHYTKSYELSLDDFEPVDEFEAELPALTCKVGEPLTVTMTGVADRIDFWSGEEGHDFAYAEKDRMQEATMSMNFYMLLNSGTQRTPLKVKYSTDFDGTMTEEAILAASWTDVSSLFDLTTYIYGTDTSTTVGASTQPYNVGTADCSDWFTGAGNSCYIAFFYHVDAYDASYVDPATQVAGNGRTYVYLHDTWVRAQYKSEDTFTEIYRQKYVDGESDPSYPIVVFGPTFDDSDGTNPLRIFSYGSYPYVLRLGAAFRPTEERNSYLVLPRLERPAAKNVGKDQPFVVKGEEDPQPQSYEYLFTQPGVYEVAVVGTTQTLAGPKQIIKQATVTVTAE